MKSFSINRRRLMIAGATAILAGCQVVPKTTAPAPRPAPAPTPEPTQTGLPTDDTRHRIALLVPLSGDNGAVGQSIANATTMALLDTNAQGLRITSYDTANGERAAARQAIADGAKLILGPLMSTNVGPILAEARPADVPIIAFSNDTAVAGPGVFVMGHIPEQSIARSVRYARRQGDERFAAVIPEGDYGARAEAAFRETVISSGGTIANIEPYQRGNTSIVSAVRRLASQGGYDVLLIADGPELAVRAASETRETGSPRILGTALWSGENSVARASSLNGAVFSAVSDGRYRQFRDSYESRFGNAPYRIATLGYDAVLLTLNIANDWKVGNDFPVARLRDTDGFLGLDGPFRFQRNGLIQRAMEVRQVRDGEVVIVDQAPQRFDD